MQTFMTDYMWEIGIFFATLLILGIIYYVTENILGRQLKGKSDWTVIQRASLFGILLIGLFYLLDVNAGESEEVTSVTEKARGILKLLGTIVAVIIGYYAMKLFLDQRGKGKSDWSVIRTSVLFLIALIGSFATIYMFPINEQAHPNLKGEIFKLMGIVISAVLALGSATLIGNVLAGIMLQTINSFKPGDFIGVNDYFGRVTERRLFHTEIQTEDGDLTTIPNLLLATNAVKVTRKVTKTSGPFISGVCSLGYDVNREKIEKALLEAATKADLEEAFVRITELGDFSVSYKVYGMFNKEGHLMMKAQSTLHAMMLDELHKVGIEIVSPNFMNQRQIGDAPLIPLKAKKHEKVEQTDEPEDILFDKSIEAESIEKRKENLEGVEERLKNLAEELKTAAEENLEQIKVKIEKWTVVKEKMKERIAEQKDDLMKNN